MKLHHWEYSARDGIAFWSEPCTLLHFIRRISEDWNVFIGTVKEYKIKSFQHSDDNKDRLEIINANKIIEGFGKNDRKSNPEAQYKSAETTVRPMKETDVTLWSSHENRLIKGLMTIQEAVEDVSTIVGWADGCTGLWKISWQISRKSAKHTCKFGLPSEEHVRIVVSVCYRPTCEI